MITFTLKFLVFFSLSFLILTIPVNGKKLFNIIDNFTAPMTMLIHKNVKNTADLGKQLFVNSKPRHTIYNDHIRKKQAAILNDRKKHVHDTEEIISITEQSELTKLIESSEK